MIVQASNPVALHRLSAMLETNQWAGVFNEAIPTVSQGVQFNFANRTGPANEKWAPRKDKLPHPLLIKSGAMLAAAAWKGAGAIREVTGNSLTWGISLSEIKYAGFQHLGTQRIPARQYLGLNDEYCAEVKQVINAGAARQINGVFS